MDVLTNYLSSVLLFATPTLLAGLGIVFSERAGIVNIGTEGMMLVGALAGYLGSFYLGSAWLGILVAMAASVIFAAIFAVFTVIIKADQTVIGTGMNTLAVGVTVTVSRLKNISDVVDKFEPLAIPGLCKIPVIGPALFKQSLPVYLALIFVPIASFVLYRTNVGLKVRSVGENPKACDTVGINVALTRFMSVLYSGALAGFAGCFISIGQTGSFIENIVAGGGFIALAAVVFGNYTPFGILGSSMVFGASLAFAPFIQSVTNSFPTEFPRMLPYLITVVSLCIVSRRSNKPAGSAKPYVKS